MSYTLRTTQSKQVDHKFSGEGLTAIQYFIKLQKAIKRVENLEAELQSFVNAMPDEDVHHYAVYTDNWLENNPKYQQG